MQKGGKKKWVRKPQHQRKPGVEYKMDPAPVFDNQEKGSGKLRGRVVLISGGDSGIGRAVAVLFAKEGADISIIYKNEHTDAGITKKVIEETYHKKCLLVPGNITDDAFCKRAVEKTKKTFGKIDILINNAGVHFEHASITDITPDELKETFATNIFSMFYLTAAALKYMPAGSSVINTTSVTAYRGSANLIDYSSTKGAVVSFTRSLSSSLIKKNIRVNAVAPGPVWTPLIVSSFDTKQVATFGTDSPMERAAQPVEIATAYLFLASDDASYISGQVIHVNGGEIVNG